MNYSTWPLYNILVHPDKYERLKVFILSFTFLLVIGAYTIVYDLKNSIFVTIVGKEYIPVAKMISMFALIPAVLFYSLLVDLLKRHHLLYFYSIAYGLFGAISAYLIGHPIIGIANTASDKYRLFGWFFYFFVEGFSPFIVSVFWSFANSITNPEDAKAHYGILVTGSKIGGMLSAGIAWAWLLSIGRGQIQLSDALSHQLLLLFFTGVMVLIAFVIFLFMRYVPSRYLHGYEASYKLERKQEHEESKPGMLSGLWILLQRPYLLGIFGMIFFYEILGSILSFLRLEVAHSAGSSICEMSAELYRQMFFMHLVGFFISIFGTSTLLRTMGERFCLLLIPISSGLLLLFYTASYFSQSVLLWVFIVLKSVNYAFSLPVRESLYIPTTKDIRFKSKSWVDAFGSKLARGVGSTINVWGTLVDHTWYFAFHSGIFFVIVVSWIGTAFFLANKYTKVIKNNEVIS